MLDARVVEVVERAVGGERISPAELAFLFELDTLSAEAAHVRWAARTIAAQACEGTGQIYAQIGIDALPCPANCGFCAFAAARSRGVTHDAVVPKAKVVEYARAFDDAGVHLISLMSTAGLPFDQVIEVVRTVRNAVSDDMPLLVNTGDMTAEQARELKAAGAQAVYHAHRLGEGEITRLAPKARLATMRNVKAAGLKLMNAVEPVHEDVSAADVLARMVEAASFEPYCSGVGTLTSVAGTPLEGVRGISRERAAFYAAIFRLMVGTSIPFGTGGGNVMWSDAGTNPRGRALPVDVAALDRDVARVRKELVGREWNVPARPLPGWFA